MFNTRAENITPEATRGLHVGRGEHGVLPHDVHGGAKRSQCPSQVSGLETVLNRGMGGVLAWGSVGEGWMDGWVELLFGLS